MMKSICMSVVCVVMVMFVAGCASTPDMTTTMVSPPVEPRAPASARQVANVIKSKVIVAVRDTSSPSDETTREIVKKTEGRLIRDGFEVKNVVPFMTVSIGTDIVLFDKIGNYYVYEGKSDADVRRHDSQVLGRKQLVQKGTRSLEQFRAKRAVSDKLANSVAEWVGETCTSTAMGLEAVVVTMQISEWQAWLNGSETLARKRILEFLKQAKKVDGILSCQLVNRDRSNRLFRFRIVYQADKFPGGIATGIVSTKDVPRKRIESNPVLWLIKAIFGIASAAI